MASVHAHTNERPRAGLRRFVHKCRQDLAGAAVGLTHSQRMVESHDEVIAYETARRVARWTPDIAAVLDQDERLISPRDIARITRRERRR